MKNKGFTLIELLAVIILIGLIAVITIPKITKQVEDSKKNIAKSSAYSYKKAVNEYTLGQQLNKNIIELNGTYEINDDGYLYKGNNTIEVDFSGEKPKNGYLSYIDNDLQTGCITINKYKITFQNGEVSNVEKGECNELAQEKIAQLNGEIKNDGAKYFKNAIEIYYNPTTGQKCNSTDSVSTTGTTTGCMHWYLYSAKDNYANMLLDHNITETEAENGAWANEDDYKAGLTELKNSNNITIGYSTVEGTSSKAISAGITYPSTITSFPLYGGDPNPVYNPRGPVTALNTLKELTSTWKTDIPKIPNNTGLNENIIREQYNDNKFIIDYSNYHARIITYEEAKALGCTTVKDTCPTWMSDNLSINQSKGYWTSTPNEENNIFVYYVTYENSQLADFGYNKEHGIRPIITVNINDVL